MGNASPAISVILTCRDLADYVGDAIAALRAQEFQDFEALVVDDGSDDASVAVIREAIAGDSRFRLICQDPSGLSVARNLGLDQTRGAMIAFLDGDDLCAPQFLGALHQELVTSGADWVACAVQLFWPDGRRFDHSAIHGEALQTGPAQWCDLQDARAVARHFPSAWNKLYRRCLIGDTRFIAGALFEDHPFFWSLACKAGRIRYLPQPLYHYRRGRPGQITDRGDDGMIQQIDRLQDVAAIARASALDHVAQGLSQLATRLVHERLEPPAEPSLKAAFLDRAAQVFAQEKLHWDRAGAQDISPVTAPILDPGMRLSVLICAGPQDAVAATKASLEAQALPVWDVRIVSSQSAVATLLDALPVTKTAWIACLKAGDQPGPDWAVRCLEQGRDAGAKCVIAGARLDGAQVEADFDPGMALPASGLAAPDPAALVLHRSAADLFPPELRQRLAALPEPLAAVALAAQLRAGSAVVEADALRLSPRPPAELMALAQDLQRIAPDLCPLDQTARASAFAHLAQMQMARATTRARRLLLALRAGIARRRAGLPPPAPVPHLGPILRRCLGAGRTIQDGS